MLNMADSETILSPDELIEVNFWYSFSWGLVFVDDHLVVPVQDTVGDFAAIVEEFAIFELCGARLVVMRCRFGRIA